ncbi:hypothetical protein Ancab_001589 [Ancistrocladus abbreviatus]
MEAQEGNSSDIRRAETEAGSANASNTSNFIEDFNDVLSNEGDFDHSAIDPSVRPSKKVRSKVWDHLIKICAENLKDQRAKCKYCGAILGADPAKELLRKNKRMLDKSIREIERERQGLQAQEKKLIVEIKKSAKQGQMGAVRVMANDLIRTRHQIEKFYKLKSQLQGVALRIQTLKSTQAMGEAMKGVTKAMGQMNRQMNLPSLQRIMQEFEKQNERMELTSEVMGDAIDDALEGDEEEEETEELVNQVLDEIGIDVNQELVNAPSSAVAAPAAKTKVAQAEVIRNEDSGMINCCTRG